jgi:hypothetical protein
VGTKEAEDLRHMPMSSTKSMKTSKLLILLMAILAFNGVAQQAFADSSTGLLGGGPPDRECMYYKGAGRCMKDSAPESAGGKEEKTEDQELKQQDSDAGQCGVKGLIDAQWGVPASAAKLKGTPGAVAGMKANAIDAGAANGALLTGQFAYMAMATGANMLAASINAPGKQMQAAKANLDSQATEMANALAEVEKQQAATAIDFCSSFLINFSADGGNKWNKLRDSIFVPMAILLLLPGAVLTQVKSIIAAGTPVLGEANPFEGIQRSIIAIFLIPGTYLVINYSIDLNNSITYSIADQYRQTFGSDMYKDAISFHIRAFPARQPAENRNALDQQTTPMGPLLNGKTPFARFEGLMIENKIEDPVAKLYLAPPDRADECLPISSIAAKEMFNSTNATFMIAWNILCAFQMIYFYYLWFVGPLTAALWVWPMKSLRNAFPSWCEGVITLGFWSLFWNTSILLMACFRGVDETGTLVLTALNFLATSSVKYAFDFAGLAKAAGQEAANMAEKAAKAAQKGGGGGGGGGGGKGGGGHGHAGAGHHGGGHHAAQPHHAETPGGPKAPEHRPETTPRALPLSEHLAALHQKDDKCYAAPGDPNFKLGADRGGPEVKPPPGVEGDKAVRTLPGDSFTVGDGGAGGHMFTRAMVDGKPVLQVTDMEGNAVKGMDGKDLAPISLSGIAEGGSRTVAFDPGADGKARGSITIEQGSHGGQLYHASSHGHSELVSYSGGHLSGHSSAAVDSGMHAAMFGNKPVAELQPGLFYGTDGNGNGALYDIDHNQINFDSDGNATLEDGRSLHMDTQADGSQLLSVNGGHDLYALSAHGANINVAHGDMSHDPYQHPINSLSMGRDANTGASIASLFNDHGMRTESSATLGADTQRAYYNPDTQALLGSSFTHNFDNGDSYTTFNRDDGSLVGTNMYQMTDDGFRETVFDGDGNAVSMQQTSYDDNGYSLTTANFQDGSITNASVSQFDNSGSFMSSHPLDFHQMQSIAGDVSSLSQYANSYSSGVVPDGNLFGSSTARTSQNEVANNYGFTANRVEVVPPVMFDPKGLAEQKPDPAAAQTPQMFSKVEAPAINGGDGQKIMPVDIAGTQLSSNKDFSQIDGAYAANASSQGRTAEVAYSNPVVTSSIDIMPPQVLDSTPLAYQQAELNAPKNSLESQMAHQVGELSVTAANASNTFNFNDAQGPPTGAFGAVAKEAAPDVTHINAGIPQNNTVLPVDIAGTQLDNKAALELSQNSQIEGAYAANLSSQGRTAEVAYSTPVTTSNIDIAPPIQIDSTPMAYQQAELDAPKASLESMMANQVGGLSVTADNASTTFNFNDTQGPPAGAFGAVAKEAAPDVTHINAGLPQNNTVLPVDIAGTQLDNKAALELSQNSQIEGAYAANLSSQGRTAEVAYSTPVTTSNIDIAPPIQIDSTPVAYQQAELNAPKASLESMMANQVGGLSVTADNSATTFNYGDTQAPPAGAIAAVSKDAAPDVNNINQMATPQIVPQNNTVMPVDIAGTQIASEQAAYELAQNAQIQGAYAANNSSQGQTAEVAYTTPVTTSNIDIAPPINLDATPVAYQQAELTSAPPSLETVMSNQVGNITAGADASFRTDAPVVSRDATADQTYVTHAPQYGDIVHQGGTVEAPQVTQGPDVRPAEPQYPQPRTESVAQLASAAALASNAQQHLLGEPRVEHRAAQGPVPNANAGAGATPKRGLGSIFSDITMGKKTVKPANQVTPKVDPNAQQKGGVVANPNDPNAALRAKGAGQGVPTDHTKLMGKMRDSVDAETTMQLSTGQSLEKQMIQAGSHVQAMPASTLNSILGKTNASVPQKPSEHLNNALVDYHTVSALIHEGKANEAALVAGNALANISRCAGNEPQLLPLVRAFVELFNQKHMIHQAKAFAEKEKALTDLAKSATASRPSDNVWGS